MFQKQIEKIKSMIKTQKEQTNKKKIENLVVFLIILIITIIAINTIWNDDNKNSINEKSDGYKQLAEKTNNINTNIETGKTNLEERLEEILRKIEGVGDVDVLITYSETSQLVAMYNEDIKESQTEETDTSGGTRKITESDTSKEVIYKEENGEKIPITQKTIMPQIKGAIIIARRGRKCYSKN